MADEKYYVIINEKFGVVIGAMPDRSFIYSEDPFMSQLLTDIVHEIPVATSDFVQNNTHDDKGNKYRFLPVISGKLTEIWNNNPTFFQDHNLVQFVNCANNYAV